MKRIIVTLKLNFAPSTTPLLWSSPAVQVSAAEGLARLIAALGPEYVQGSGEILSNAGFAVVRLTVTDRGVEIVRNFWDVQSVQFDTVASTFMQPDMMNAPVYSMGPVQTAVPVPTVGVSLPGAGAPLGVPPTMATTDAGEVPSWLLWGGLIAVGFYLMRGNR